MDEELNLVTEWLLSASSQIPAEYFQVPVAGAEEPYYRERVYCYELYHCWRNYWRDGFPFSLSGEVDKRGHRLVRGDWKPDFLVHVPGRMRNLLVVEVKPANSELARMADDLKKLTYFRRELRDHDGHSANYHAAYFWIYGLPTVEWPRLKTALLQLVQGDAQFDRNLVSCIIHERSGVRATLAVWE